MKKETSIVFQINFSRFEDEGKARFFSLYRLLRKNRRLARFCRQAFIEKAGRHLSGLENSYLQLDSILQTKGVQYILDSIREKERQIPNELAVSSISIDEAKDPTNNIPNELAVSSISIDEAIDPTNNKPDIEKLRGLL